MIVISTSPHHLWTKPPTVQEVNDDTGSPEKTVPRESDVVRRTTIEGQRMDNLARIRDILPGQADAVGDVGYELQMALANYLIRPGSDPEVVVLVRDLVRQLASIGSGDDRPLPEEQLLDFKAGLVGAAMVLA